MSMNTRDLLFELGTEELPPSALQGLLEALPAAVVAGLDQAGIAHGEARVFGSPRHLAVRVADVAEAQPDRTVERKGPAVQAAYDANGAPTKAAEGFARSCGVALEALERLTTDKGEWLAYRGTEAGQTTATLLPDILRAAVDGLPLPKRMRWGAGEDAFIRPVHWLVVLFGGEIVPCEILGAAAGRHTRGHRFHCPDWLALETPADYEQRLADPGHVLVDFAERRARVAEQVEAAGQALGGQAVMEPELLDEVTALVEWPVALSGSFDPAFLRVPAEALVSSMQGHQKYFPVRDSSGALMPRFITVANLESRAPEQVVTGNERVIRPRLADAAFFWDQDRRQPLHSRLDGLASVVFQKGLGSLRDKSERVARLAARLAPELGVDAQHAERAGQLCKADLLTEMVGEFPELQGTMGRYYAREDGEPEAVAVALAEAYEPRFAGDRLPASGTGRLVALADRLDTLVGAFAVGKTPTGAKDPLGLRRAALGVVRICIEGELPLDLVAVIETSRATLIDQGVTVPEDTVAQVHAFILDRLRPYSLERGHSPDSFEAVRQRQPRGLLDFEHRLRAVEAFRGRPEAESLAAANKRIRNILRKSEAEGELAAVDEALLHDPAERDLLKAVGTAEATVDPAVGVGDYSGALDALAALRPPVDRFFDDVMVMAEDAALRRNRLALLDRLSRAFLKVADISELQG